MSFIFLLFATSSTVSAQSLQVIDDVPGSFQDISGSQPIKFGFGDEIVLPMSIGNFVFPSGSIVVANNGGVAFGSPPNNDLAPDNEPLPSTAAFGGGQAILAFWDDFDDKDGDVYFISQEDRAIIQWNDRRLSATPTSTARFQLQVFQNPGPTGLVAQLIFGDIEQPGVEGGLSATIGYQDGAAGFGNAQWSFDTSGAVADGTVLSLIVDDMTTMPTVSEWGLIVFCLVVLTTASIGIRRLNHRGHVF